MCVLQRRLNICKSDSKQVLNKIGRFEAHPMDVIGHSNMRLGMQVFDNVQ